MISVIVPVLNEEKILRTALAELLRQEGSFEVIVVDGGSEDGTANAARGTEGVRFMTAGPGRGAQMNAGARAARGAVLLFLHIDTRLPARGLLAVQDAVDRGVPAGAFRHRFEDADWRLRLISAGHNLKCRLTRIYYGDHAIFVRRDVFERVGGFPEVPVLEDVIFCQRLRRHVRSRPNSSRSRLRSRTAGSMRLPRDCWHPRLPPASAVGWPSATGDRR